MAGSFQAVGGYAAGKNIIVAGQNGGGVVPMIYGGTFAPAAGPTGTGEYRYHPR